MENEIWEEIPDYNGRYEVSTFGRVRSTGARYTMTRGGKTFTSYKKPRILKFDVANNGYLRYCLRNKYKSNHKTAHRLVALAFIPNPDNLETVNHIDGDKTNNHVSNLEWLSIGENHKHAFRLGLKCHKGEHNTQAKLTWKDVAKIRKMEGTQVSIGKIFNVCGSVIGSIKRNETWKINGN